MTPNTKVQFVIFETTLSSEPFIKRWSEFKRSPKSDADVTVQQSDHNGTSRYIAQHRFASEEVQFVFTKEKRSSRVAQEIIKSTKAGGYSILQVASIFLRTCSTYFYWLSVSIQISCADYTLL